MSSNTGQLHVLGIDPGKAKCGLAVLTSSGRCVHRQVVGQADLVEYIFRLASKYPLEALVIGDKTASCEIQARLRAALVASSEPVSTVPVHVIPEHLSTVEARQRYLVEHRHGWRRWVPIGLQTPPEPYDDYTAEVLANRFIDARRDLAQPR